MLQENQVAAAAGGLPDVDVVAALAAAVQAAEEDAGFVREEEAEEEARMDGNGNTDANARESR